MTAHKQVSNGRGRHVWNTSIDCARPGEHRYRCVACGARVTRRRVIALQSAEGLPPRDVTVMIWRFRAPGSQRPVSCWEMPRCSRAEWAKP